MLDTSLLKSLDDAEIAAFNALVDIEKKKVRPLQEEVIEQYVIDEASKLIEVHKAKGKDLLPEDAEKTIRARCQGGMHRDLFRDDIIYFDKHGAISVADILVDFDKYDGKTCSDPQEPELGRGKAKLYFNEKDKKPCIHSFAHGGIKYFLHDLPPGSKIQKQLKNKDGKRNVSEKLQKELLAINQRHAVMYLGGKCVVMNELIDPALNTRGLTFSSPTDFKNFYANHVLEYTDRKGNPQKIKLADAWFKSKIRRQYHGLVFDPGKDHPGYYNLWRGFAIEPKAGDWSLIRAHILYVVASNDKKLFTWILGWFARILQDPGGERPGTSLVFRGKQGCGKGIIINAFGEILGPHYLPIHHSKQLVGHFNAHLKGIVLAFCDESFWAGDKAAEGVLKSMITEPFINVEHKGKDAVRMKNHVNLCIASNNDWVVPAGLEERRHAVIDVSDCEIGNREYFNALGDQMQNGGIAAMMHDLLEMDISQVDLKAIPRTQGLFEQILNSMDTVQKYWFQRLSEGSLRPQNGEESEQYSDHGACGWNNEVLTEDQYNDYWTVTEKLKDRFPLCEEQFAIALKKLCPDFKKKRIRHNGSRVYVREFPPLDFCRAEFEELVKMDIDWGDEDDDLSQ